MQWNAVVRPDSAAVVGCLTVEQGLRVAAQEFTPGHVVQNFRYQPFHCMGSYGSQGVAQTIGISVNRANGIRNRMKLIQVMVGYTTSSVDEQTGSENLIEYSAADLLGTFLSANSYHLNRG